MTLISRIDHSRLSSIDSLLQQAGVRVGQGFLENLLPGIVAAPEAEQSDRWLSLIDPLLCDPDHQGNPAIREARQALLDVRQQLADLAGDGLEGASAQTMAGRLKDLRSLLREKGLRGFLVPRADEHQGEYVARHACRLAWMTGFTGSAGLAAILDDRACLFVDGRYTLQVREEVDGEAFTFRHLIDEPASDWLAEILQPGDRLGYDPFLHTIQGVEKLVAACTRAGAEAVPCESNLVDAIWDEQPARPLAPAILHSLDHAGESSADKRKRCGQNLQETGADSAFLSAPDAIAWLLNLRGGDIPRTPVMLGFALLQANGQVALFADPRKFTDAVRNGLGPSVTLLPVEDMDKSLEEAGKAGRKVLLDPASCPARIASILKGAGAEIVTGDDPCLLPRACKNATEIEGSRSAHFRDGLALTRFLAWLHRHAPSARVTEMQAAEKLLSFRREDPMFRDLSFDTIAGSGPNGAIVHYRVTEESDRPLEARELFLLDSGGQYPDGTTDVTRTVAVTEGDAEQRDRFTRVLKGHIALASAIFPIGTTGAQLDALARAPLWAAGLDFDHGTGHGVGSYLSVHEGPQRISRVAHKVALQPGMILSNEPGYYKSGAWGIRIENLLVVRTIPCEELPGGSVGEPERPVLGFETLTLAPIDRRLIEPGLLAASEIEWLNSYHRRVREAFAPILDQMQDVETARWLEEVTAPL